MRWTPHYLPANRPHATLSASKYHWIKYDEDKMIRAFMTQQAAQKGTELHALAALLIKHGQKLPDTGQTMSLYVNDAIGFMLQSEQVLFVSDNCYGTADAIGFRNGKLRVSDYKSGITPTSFSQLKVYVAMFCLEYKMKPFEIEIEMRIYQNDEVRLEIADPDEITHIMDKIRTFDVLINELKAEAL